jgi:hypothetical protein
MKTPIQYQHEVDQLLGQGKPSPESFIELERNLQLDIHALKMQFTGRAASALKNNSHQSGKERAEVQERLDEEKEKRIKPYQDLLDKVKENIKTE